jgi:hypothetical protein
MKTPTNFVPIIGPLYADDLHLNSHETQVFNGITIKDIKPFKCPL